MADKAAGSQPHNERDRQHSGGGRQHSEGDREEELQQEEDGEGSSETATVDTVVDAIFASPGGQELGGAAAPAGSPSNKPHSSLDSGDYMEELSEDDVVRRPFVSGSDTEEEEDEEEMIPLSNDGDDRGCTKKMSEGAQGEVGREAEQAFSQQKVSKEEEDTEDAPPPRVTDQAVTDTKDAAQTENGSADEGHASADGESIPEECVQAEDASQASETTPRQDDEDGDTARNDQDSGEDESCLAAEQQSGDGNYEGADDGDIQFREPSHSDSARIEDGLEVAQDLVQHVLDRVVRAESDTGEVEGGGRGDLKPQGTSQLSPLDMVALNSEDWGSDLHSRDSCVQDSVSLSAGGMELDSKQRSGGESPHSQQTPLAAGDADTQQHSGDKELPADTQWLDQDSELTPQLQGMCIASAILLLFVSTATCSASVLC